MNSTPRFKQIAANKCLFLQLAQSYVPSEAHVIRHSYQLSKGPKANVCEEGGGPSLGFFRASDISNVVLVVPDSVRKRGWSLEVLHSC